MYLQYSGPYAGAGNDQETLARSNTLALIRDAIEDINLKDM